MNEEIPVFKCSECAKEFGSAHALKSHTEAKHLIKKSGRNRLQLTKKHWNYIKIAGISSIVLLVIAFVGVSFAPNIVDCATAPAETLNIGGHSDMALHIHPIVKISIFGSETTIPANVGVNPNWMSSIHTHDSTGKLHVESPCFRSFALLDFFKIWDKTLNGSCIFEYCSNETNSLRILVNGVETSLMENTILKDNDIINIIYN